jgi:hypothetical protein
MAKKTPQFNSQQAKTKWASLENQAGTSLNRIVEGKATAGDIQKVSSTLSQLSTVAHTVFTEAVDSATKTALAVQKAGQIEVRDGLSEFETALNNALKTSFKETQEQIVDAIELDLLIQTEELTKTVGSSFADLRELLPPKDLPTVDDLLANNELLAEQSGQQLQETAERQSDFMLDSIYSMMKELMSNLKVKIPTNALAPAGGGYAKGRRHVTNPYQLAEPTLADQGAALVGPELPGGVAAPSVEEGEGITEALSGTQALKKADMAEEAVDTQQLERDRMSHILDRMESFLEMGHTTPRVDPDKGDDEKKEQKKADTWWRSFKNYAGKKRDQAKDWTKDLLKSLAGVGLLSLIFDPNLWTTIADNIEQYVTWDNLKKAAVTGWSWLEDKSTGLVDWVLDKLGVGGKGTHPQAKLTPAAQAQFDQLDPQTKLTSVGGPQQQAAYIMSLEKTPGDPTSLSAEGQSMLTAASPETKKAYQAMQYGNETLVQRVGRGFNMMGSSISNFFTGGSNSSTSNTTVTGGNVGQRSTVAVPNAPAVPGLNSTVVNSSFSVAPGVALDPGESVMQTSANTTNTPAAVGAAPMGINSFGIQSSVDDHLLLMNSTILGH